MRLDFEKANKIYDILVNLGGAVESFRDSFIYHHVFTEEKHSCDEWRFSGKLGFGGKYRSRTNSVDCYKEDENSAIIRLIEKINHELKKEFGDI